MNINGILQEVKENIARLDSCPGPHIFVDINPPRTLVKNYLCTKCHGTVDSHAYRWYSKGQTHGSANSKEV
jgi:hypothetical protein